MKRLVFGDLRWGDAFCAPLPEDGAAALATVDAALDALGGLDAVVVRLARPEAPTAEAVEASLRPLFWVARAAIWELIAAEHPSLTAVLDGPPAGLAGHAQHSGAHAFQRSVAKEYGKSGLRCNGLRLDGPVAAPRLQTALDFLAFDAHFVTGETLTLIAESP